MIRIVVADSHALMREGLMRILGETSTISVVSEAGNAYEALAQARAGGFDVMLLDLSMPGRPGMELIRQLKSEAPEVAVLVLTMHETAQYAVPAIRAGARGYLNKTASAAQLVAALHCVASGRIYLEHGVAEQLALPGPSPAQGLPHTQLSEREHEVFSRLVLGQTVTVIGQQMGISAKTVSTHKARLLDKMGMATVSQLVRYAMAHNLLATLPP